MRGSLREKYYNLQNKWEDQDVTSYMSDDILSEK